MVKNYDRDDEIDTLRDKVSNWGRWGDDDELGTLNYITTEVILRANKLVKTGRTVSLAREHAVEPYNADDHYTYEQYKMNIYPTHSNDFVGVLFHGYKFTHLDGLCHIFTADGKMYNGYDSSIMKETGTPKLGIEQFSHGIISRGVLVDVARYKNKIFQPGEVIYLEDIINTLQNQNIAIMSGDILLVRSGAGKLNDSVSLAGIHPEVIPWLHENEISILGNDGGNDYIPNSYQHYIMPIHQIVIPYMGMPLIDNAELDELSQVCADENRWEFQLILAPWRLKGVSGSLINPIAVF